MLEYPIKGSYKSRRCFIVAPGPSLAYKDLSFLKDEITIALNLSILTLNLFDINPTFSIVADKYQYSNFSAAYEALTFNKPTKKIIVASACDTFPERLKDSSTFFFPNKLQQEIPSFSENCVEQGFARGKTVAFDAIQFAYYLGFKEIYIIGMDMGMGEEWGISGHSYEVHKNKKFPDLIFPDKNSYEITRGAPGHPEYVPFIEKCMSLANIAFKKEGRKIFNDIRSALDIFDKKDILKEFGASKKIVAFVPAKGTSTRVQNKNARTLGNKPLFLHILDTLLSCRTINEVYLDTESDKIFKIASSRMCKQLRRDSSLATNKTNGNELLLNEASQVEADIYVQALPTAPFISRETIDEAVFALLTSKEKDSVFTVKKDKFYLWSSTGTPKYNIQNIPNSADLEDTIFETMGLYIIRKESLLREKSRIGRNPIMFEVSLIESIDIDTYDDFDTAEIIFRGKEVLK